MVCQETDRSWRGLPAWIGQRHTLSGGQVFKGASHAGTVVGCGDRPGDELRRSHEWLERGHQLDVRRGAHELPERGVVFPEDRKSTTSELQSHLNLVCRLLLEKKKIQDRHRL